MNQNLQSSAPSGRGLCPEDVVIIVVVGIGFVGSVIIYGLDLPPIMVAIFLATGVASLVYRFLGGIQSATFNIGPVKLAGTIAALISCAWFINTQLEQQTKCNLNTDSTPNVNSWFAIDKDNLTPVRVTITGVKGSIEKPDSNFFAKKELDIRHEDKKFKIIASIPDMPDSDFVLGHVMRNDLREINLFNTMEGELDEFIVTGRLPADTQDVDLTPIPFKLSTGSYGNDRSPYTLTDTACTAGTDCKRVGWIQGRQAEIVKLGGKYYLVGVVEVNHTLKDSSYAKFVVGEIATDIEP